MAKKKSSIGFDPLARMKDSRPSSVVGRPSTAKTDDSRDGGGRATHGAVAEDRRPRTEDSVISLGDSLTLADVGARHVEWKQTLAAGGPIEIDAGSLKTVDTAALQLLAALAREAQTRGLSLCWRASSDVLRQGAERLGLKAAMRLS